MPGDQPDSWAIALAGVLIALGFFAECTDQAALAIVFRIGAVVILAWVLVTQRGGRSSL